MKGATDRREYPSFLPYYHPSSAALSIFRRSQVKLQSADAKRLKSIDGFPGVDRRNIQLIFGTFTKDVKRPTSGEN